MLKALQRIQLSEAREILARYEGKEEPARKKPAVKKARVKARVKATPAPAPPEEQPDCDKDDDEPEDDEPTEAGAFAFSFASLDPSAKKFLELEARRDGKSVEAVLRALRETAATPRRNRSIRDLGEEDAMAVRHGFDGGRQARKARAEIGLPPRDPSAPLPTMFVSHGPPQVTPPQSLAQAKSELEAARRRAGVR